MKKSLPKILIVDDLPANLRAMENILSRMDAEIFQASSGNEALLLCTEQDFALVLLDVNMPVLNGFEVARLLRGVERTRELPIIFVTAAATDAYQTIKGFEVGAVDFILKPIDDRVLLSKVHVFVDLYNRKAQLQEKNAELQQLQNILLLMMDALFFISPEGIITEINQNELFGYSSCELISTPVQRLFLNEETLFNGSSLVALIQAEKINNTEATLLAKGGREIPVLLSGSTRRDTGERVKGFVLVAKNITDYKQAQRALREKEAQLVHSGRLTAMGEMATGIAHELNQPLTVIRIWSQSLGQDLKRGVVVEDRVRRASEEITQQIDRASSIIHHMSAFARVENRQPDKAMDPAIPTEQSLLFFEEQFRIHEIELDLEIGQNLPLLYMHANRFEQIVVNLLSNARYAVDKKGKTDLHQEKKIALRLTANSDRDSVILEVEDNGIGMTDEEAQRCLEPFFTTKEVGQGTGLGLHIVRGIVVEELKGKLMVSSQLGKGTVICVTLPTVNPDRKLA